MEQNGCSGGVCPLASLERRADDRVDVFEEDPVRLHRADACLDEGEQVAFVRIGVPSSGA
jgi:hypothetical protein